MTDKTLWEQFNLAEANPDQGGGILYCLRYDAGRIEAHQESVVGALSRMGIELEDTGEDIGVRPREKLDEPQKRRVYALLEELSCLNEALEYAEMGLNQCGSVSQLRVELVGAYHGLLLKKTELADAYDTVTRIIPEIVIGLRIADHKNRVLSPSDRRELTDLADYAERQADMLNNPRGTVMYGLR